VGRDSDACTEPGSTCEDTALVACEGCSIEIEKKVAKDDGCNGTRDSDWLDFVKQPIGECVIYQICVTNTGNVEIDDAGVLVSDADLLIADLNFGTLPPNARECKEIPVDAQAPACTDPDDDPDCLCEEVWGTNTAVITAAICDLPTPVNPCADPDNPREGSVCKDDAEVDCEVVEVGACRMTGGHVNQPKEVNLAYSDSTTKVTTGGQIGAPNETGCCTEPPTNRGRNSECPWGDWEHNHHYGPDDLHLDDSATGISDGMFAFHSGTAAAPDAAFIQNVKCDDEGWCVQARPAPFKQIYWEGTGVFHNIKVKGREQPLPNFLACGENQPVVWSKNSKEDPHVYYYTAHVGDFGEPAGQRQKAYEDCSLKDAPLGVWSITCDGVEGGDLIGRDTNESKTENHPLCLAQDCSECPDWYDISIHCGPDSSSPVAYTFKHFILGGNFQLHPPVGDSCNFSCEDGICEEGYLGITECDSCLGDCAESRLCE
jgi:hypothetical protein